MRGIASIAVLCAAVMVLFAMPGPAQAAVSVDIGFDPAQVCAGDNVQFFFSLENVGQGETIATLSVTFTYNGMPIGPFTMDVPLAAGQEIAKEIAFRVPPMTPPGTLGVTVSATDADGTVGDSAELNIISCGPAAGMDSAKGLINNFRLVLSQIGLR